MIPISADRVVPVAVPGLSITTTYDVFRSIEILRRADVSLIDTGHIHHINYGTFHTRFPVALHSIVSTLPGKMQVSADTGSDHEETGTAFALAEWVPPSKRIERPV
jgi:hypothetical protein